MPRPPGSARVLDLQSLKQANSTIARAIVLYEKNTIADDKEAVAQVQLAWRFLDEFVEKHET